MSDSDITEQRATSTSVQPVVTPGALPRRNGRSSPTPEATTYTAGQPASWIGVFADRSEAEALADEYGGTFIEWTGRTGRVVTTAEHDLGLEA